MLWRFLPSCLTAFAHAHLPRFKLAACVMEVKPAVTGVTGNWEAARTRSEGAGRSPRSGLGTGAAVQGSPGFHLLY